MNHGHFDDDYEDEESDIEYLSTMPGGFGAAATQPSTSGSGGGNARAGGSTHQATTGGGGVAAGRRSTDSSRPSSRASNVASGSSGRGGGGLFEQLMGFGGMGGMAAQMAQAQMMAGMGGRYAGAGPPNAFDEYFKAFSVAVMPGKERPTLSYGGKIILPPSALVSLTQLELESPWTFQLRNPKNPSLLKTHAGVLEFIADEGCCYLPYWMMKTLQLQEGDPIRLTGALLPKGKMVKIQAQDVTFLEVSDPKAVLEGALRSFTTLTKGDIIEITYNSLTFEFLIMEVTPEGPGINIIDTDLEVDFATPKGYVEPERPKPAPVPTMADKLKIDINSTTAAGSTRPASAASSRENAGSEAGGAFESFKGMGNTLGGRITKGKGKARKIEEVDKDSKITRTDRAKIVTNEMLANDGRLVPAALNLPYGKLFFGYTYKPYDPKLDKKKKVVSNEDAETKPGSAFVGSGATLSGRGGTTAQPPSASADAAASDEKPVDHWASLSGGATLRAGPPPARGTSSTAPIEIDDSMEDDDDDDGSGFDGFEDDDAIVIDDD